MLKVLKSGFYTTVQDTGRFLNRNKGVPVSGAMDEISVFKANTLLENGVNDAVLEITMTGPTLLFEEETYIVLAGAEMSATLNNLPIQNYKVYQIDVGDILSYGKLEKGFRAYLAIKGGFKTGTVLGSLSYFKPISKENRIKDGDLIPFESNKIFEPKISEIKVDCFLDDTILEVYKAPEFAFLNDKQLEMLFAKNFTVAKENNRMAYQMEETLPEHKIGILTSATLPGTVQLTPSGKIIVLMKDGQTTGGYPRILQLSDKAIAILAQKREGNMVSFKLI
ncbi:5-oxoprolinase subunit C family protein [Costertonia aggregata]|uniref:Biotin-dependent carboxyltransferase family protein n=1 Tax=Costertonia aggregata TaxID=343403 RepID=A0A7H9ATL7_9FLAO|nr:biotin-dependent carboxyltransferase family protein [Costertonia aggregata]QLG46831.1 biotin-dependent carboxyltransferase family protein [Costertonia aggregata]